jgi:hypothetical protein
LFVYMCFIGLTYLSFCCIVLVCFTKLYVWLYMCYSRF